MATTISRIYRTKADADAAVEDLKTHNFSAEEFFVVHPPSESSEDRGIVAEIADKIAQGKVLRRHAAAYAEKVAQGAVLVTVHAPFGAGYMATVLLDRHNPIEFAAEPVVRGHKYDESTPVSSSLRMPVHAVDPTPFGSFWNVPTILDQKLSISEMLGYDAVMNSSTPISSLLRLPTTANKVGLSNNFGLPLTL